MNKDAYTYALRLLSRKDYFTVELAEKLEKRFPDEDSLPVIEQLLRDRYLDDKRSLSSFVRWKANEGYGPYYIREKLRAKGLHISAEDIYEVLEAEELDLESIMRQVAAKYVRLKKSKKQDMAAFMRSAMNYMAYRGFPAGESLNILKSEVSKDESNFSEGR